MTQSRMIEIIKDLPSSNYTKQDKREALEMFAKSDYSKSVTKNELQNAIIYLLDMVDFGIKDWNCV